MKDKLVYPIGTTSACTYAGDYLRNSGIRLLDHPSPEVTHLLLDVPSFAVDGLMRGGGNIRDVLRMLPPDITVVGGNLHHPALEAYQRMDLLVDAEYLAVNAAITAECALQVAAQEMTVTFRDCPILIIGWGRIGKCLSQLLHGMGAEITIALRKASDRAMVKALGYQAVDAAWLSARKLPFRVIFNTAPEPVLHKEGANCIFLDLASKRGILGEGVIWARGLPGIYRPESSGKLIAETFLRMSEEVEK